jgi:oxygen-independent coproporphyrinogen III oxidase
LTDNMTHLPALSADLVRRYDVAAPRYTSYPTAPMWNDHFGRHDYERALAQAAARDAPLSLYVHIPFCRKMCSYCGCNVIVTRDGARCEPYLKAVDGEIGMVAERLGKRRRLSRVHLGGGTPTTLTEAQLMTLWRSITDRFTIERDAELAVEIDPMVTRQEQLALLRGMGFNRLSMGVQDFDPDVQRAVNRIQSVEDTRATLDYARALGFSSINFDLIYGLPLQTPASWTRTLEEVAAMRPDRVSLFSFAYVPELKPHQRRLPAAHLPLGMDKLALFRAGHDALVDAGYRAIGLDHFALPTDSLARAVDDGHLWRDFQGYTVERAPDTIALGTSSIGQVGGAFVQNTRLLPNYQNAIREGRLPVERGHWLSDDDRRRAAIITDLMCNGRVDLGADVADFARELGELQVQAQDGLLAIDGGVVTLTEIGKVLVRNVASVFDAYLRQNSAQPRFSRTV